MPPKVIDAIHFVVVEHRYWLCSTDVEQRLGIAICDEVPAKHARPLCEITGCTTEGAEIYLSEFALWQILTNHTSERTEAFEDWLVMTFLPQMQQGSLQTKTELQRRVIDFVNRFYQQALLTLTVDGGEDSASILFHNLHVRHSGLCLICWSPLLMQALLNCRVCSRSLNTIMLPQ